MRVLVFTALLTAVSLAPAQVTVRGILTNVPGGNSHTCVTDSTMFGVQGVGTWYVTTGWSAGPNQTDTLEFPLAPAYPDSAVITATFDDTAFIVLEIPHPSPTVVYQFPQPYRRITVQLQVIDAVEETRRAELPAGFSVTPSVIREATVIHSSRPGRLDVIDAGGRVVRTFGAPLKRVWGRDDAAGRRLEAGIYFCVLTEPGSRTMRKVVLGD